jgi:hypothetical protein
MRRQIIISGVVLSLLAGCASLSQSPVNPLNWFGPSEASPSTPQQIVRPSLAPRKGYPNFIDTRSLIANVSDVTISKTSTGAIITATGQAASTGYFDAQLVPVASETSGTLVLEFRIRAPRTQNIVLGTTKQREIVVARSISAGELSALRSVTVRAENGQRTTRR